MAENGGSEARRNEVPPGGFASQASPGELCSPNGRKLISACFESWPSRWPGRQWSKMVENGRKWWKIDFRGKMAENGFPRVIRHSPTT